MSDIRRQSILSSIIVYFGFALGILNTYLFTKQGGFTKEQYGLTGIFMAVAQIMFSLANFGMPAYIYKFYPFYRGNLDTKRNEQLSLGLFVAMLGFLLVILGGLVFKGWINKAFENSPQVITYYYWLFPFGFGLTMYSVLEAYGWVTNRSVLTNFLKEVLFRVFVTLLFILTITGVIAGFDAFIKLFSFAFLAIAAILFIYLVATRRAHITIRISQVTKKFRKKIIALCSFVWGGGIIYNVANVFDSIVIIGIFPNGLAYAAIFTLAQNICSLIQAPQRGIISASVGPLSQAWKDKDFDKIRRIYSRSSINQLVFAIAMYSLIWLNFFDGIYTFNLQPEYVTAFQVFVVLGLVRIVDMGTGVNSQIIGTSNFWRFEFITGLILLSLSLPLNFFLTKMLGLIGPAISNLIAFSVYNLIRYIFLYRKFGMQPFTWKTAQTILLGAGSFLVAYYLFRDQGGFLWIAIRSATFMVIYATGAYFLKLTPDLLHLLGKMRFGNRDKD